MKIHDTRHEPAPIDQFKVEHHPQAKTKFIVPEKPNNLSHWKNNDKIGDPEIRQGW